MEEIKENAKKDFIRMIEASWTFHKLTKTEREAWNNIVTSEQAKKALKGGYNTRWQILQLIYSSFLAGVGYNGFDWREDKKILF